MMVGRAGVVLALGAAAACGGGGASTGATRATIAPTDECIVRLHGKGERGAAPATDGTVAVLSPDGNGSGWGGRQWLYDTDARYADALSVVQRAAAPCRRVIVHGFSNGAALAAKLYCRGETLRGALVGVVIDDPVPDHGVEPCAPAGGVKVALYWTGALTEPVAGWSCKAADWTCEGGTTIGIAAYAAALGVAVQPSPQHTHQPDRAAPELLSWW